MKNTTKYIVYLQGLPPANLSDNEKHMYQRLDITDWNPQAIIGLSRMYPNMYTETETATPGATETQDETFTYPY